MQQILLHFIAFHTNHIMATDITNLQMRVCVLEDQLNLIQDTIELDSTQKFTSDNRLNTGGLWKNTYSKSRL
jgi:hypothetical protein